MNVTTAGDLGDLIFVLSILSELDNGPHTLILRDNGRTHGIEKHFKSLHKLVTSQPYIKSFELFNGQRIDWASEDFRTMARAEPRSLLDSHWAHGKRVLNSAQDIRGDKAWLHVTPDKAFNGRVILARSHRYRNDFFPWVEVVKEFRDRAVFVGIDAEHTEFCNLFGYVPRVEFSDFYKLAAAIAGSDLFVGNQSFSNALNEGLKHNSIQEVSHQFPDCLYNRPNAQYCFDGRLRLPSRNLPCLIVDPSKIQTNARLPGGWEYDGVTAPTFRGLFAALSDHQVRVTEEQVLRHTAQSRCGLFYKYAAKDWLPRLVAYAEKAGVNLDIPDVSSYT